RPARRRTRVVPAGGVRCRPCAPGAVVLVPVAVPAPPHLVDAALRDLGAELGLMVDDRRVREVVHLPARLPEPELQVDLLGIEEELLVEEADFVQRLAPQHERRTHHPVNRARSLAPGSLDTELA